MWTYETPVIRRAFLESDPGSHSTRRVGVEKRRVVMTRNCPQLCPALARHTFPTDFWLLADDHALQDSRADMLPQLFGERGHPIVLEGVASKDRVEGCQRMPDLVDALGWGDEELCRGSGCCWGEGRRLEKVSDLSTNRHESEFDMMRGGDRRTTQTHLVARSEKVVVANVLAVLLGSECRLDYQPRSLPPIWSPPEDVPLF